MVTYAATAAAFLSTGFRRDFDLPGTRRRVRKFLIETRARARRYLWPKTFYKTQRRRGVYRYGFPVVTAKRKISRARKPSARPPRVILRFSFCKLTPYIYIYILYKYKNSFFFSPLLLSLPVGGPPPTGELWRQSFSRNLPERRGKGGGGGGGGAARGPEILEKLKIVFAARSLPRGPATADEKKKKNNTLFRNRMPRVFSDFLSDPKKNRNTTRPLSKGAGCRPGFSRERETTERK